MMPDKINDCGWFGAGWVGCPDDEVIESILHGDGRGEESVEQALDRVLEGRGRC